MNRSFNPISQLTKLMLSLTAFIFVLTVNNICESQVASQATKITQFENSSRRDASEPSSPMKDLDTDDASADKSQLDSSTDNLDDDSDSLDLDSSLEHEDDEDSDEDLEDTDRPQINPIAINTDTRLLRVNIGETHAKAPADQSDELVLQGAGDSSVLPSEKLFAWAAPDIRYQPLYFEDVALERYGKTPEGCELRQTVLSAAHFFGSAALLPYKLVDQHRHSCDGPLGFCRPGSDAPFVRQRPIVQ